MATAPHSAALFAVPRSRPVPPVSAPITLGVPFSPNELGPGWFFVVEIAFGAVLSNPSSSWSWTDVTADVLQSDGRHINIQSIGRQDENPRTPPAACTFALDNRGNKYSKGNPLSPNWPNVKENTPVRVRVTSDYGANWWVFFWGEATVWQPQSDITGSYAVTEVSAKGRLQRLNQHTAPLRSAMERGIVAQTVGGGPPPLAYYPFEDGPNSTQGSNVIDSSNPAIVSPSTGVTWATDSSIAGSAPLATIASGTVVAGSVPSGKVGSFRVEYAFSIPSTAPAASSTLLSWTTSGGTGNHWRLRYNFDPTNPTITVECRNDAGTELLGDVGIAESNMAANGIPSWFGITMFAVFDVIQVGSTIHYSWTIANVKTGSSVGTIKTVAAFTLGTIQSWIFAPDANFSGSTLGHLAFFDSVYYNADFNLFTDWDDTYLDGYNNEPPFNRLIRLCQEEGIELQQVGHYESVITMGPQGIDSFVNLIQECIDAEDSFLYDGVSAGLVYQPASARYDQATAITLDAAAHELQLFQPLDDDLTRVNRATVTQKNGSTFITEQVDGPMGTGPNGIGDIDSQITINVSDPLLASFRAGWEVWKGAGSNPGFRFPLIPLNPRAHSTVANKWISRADGPKGPVVPGSRCDILNISSWMPQFPAGTTSVVIEGYAIRMTNVMFEIDILCTPNRRYDILKLNDTQYGRFQAAGSSLAADTPTGGATLTVATQAGDPVWTTSATPLYVEVDGIRVTVTGISGASSPQTFTVDGSTVTKPLLTGKSVVVWHTGVLSY